MIFVHMGHDRFFAPGDSGDNGGIEREIATVDPTRLGETANQMGPFDDKAIETEIAEPGIAFSGRMASQKAPGMAGLVAGQDPPNQANPRSGLRIFETGCCLEQ